MTNGLSIWDTVERALRELCDSAGSQRTGTEQGPEFGLEFTEWGGKPPARDDRPVYRPMTLADGPADEASDAERLKARARDPVPAALANGGKSSPGHRG